MTRTVVLTLAAAACLLAAPPARARPYHHVRYARHHRFFYPRYPDVPTYGSRVDVLETHGMGDRIISGRIGLHRHNEAGRFEPDADGPSFVLSGRASRSGVGGANGFPGSNDF